MPRMKDVSKVTVTNMFQIVCINLFRISIFWIVQRQYTAWIRTIKENKWGCLYWRMVLGKEGRMGKNVY